METGLEGVPNTDEVTTLEIFYVRYEKAASSHESICIAKELPQWNVHFPFKGFTVLDQLEYIHGHVRHRGF